MNLIHPTAVVSNEAALSEDVSIGAYVVIEGGVHIGARTSILAHSVLKQGTKIGSDCVIGEYVVLGGEPQDARFKGEESNLEIEDNVTIREFATLHRATGKGEVTKVGKGSYIMAYSHVSHNCKLEQGVTLANGVQLAGHVEVGQGAFLGGIAGVHQFVRIGRLAMLGAHSYLTQDLPPFLLGSGNPFRVLGVNRLGLERARIPSRIRLVISRLFRLIYLDSRPRSRSLADLSTHELEIPEVAEFLNFIKESRRGIRLKVLTEVEHEID